MAIEYKNSVLEITTTGSDQPIYTCPTSTGFNTTAGAGTVDIQLTDTSASATHAIRHFDSTAYAAKTTVNVTSNGPIVLESADILKINTSVQPANTFVSVMEISDDLRGV